MSTSPSCGLDYRDIVSMQKDEIDSLRQLVSDLQGRLEISRSTRDFLEQQEKVYKSIDRPSP